MGQILLPLFIPLAQYLTPDQQKSKNLLYQPFCVRIGGSIHLRVEAPRRYPKERSAQASKRWIPGVSLQGSLQEGSRNRVEEAREIHPAGREHW